MNPLPAVGIAVHASDEVNAATIDGDDDCMRIVAQAAPVLHISPQA